MLDAYTLATLALEEAIEAKKAAYCTLVQQQNVGLEPLDYKAFAEYMNHIYFGHTVSPKRVPCPLKERRP